jgi:hypothetical protein
MADPKGRFQFGYSDLTMEVHVWLRDGSGRWYRAGSFGGHDDAPLTTVAELILAHEHLTELYS